MFIIAHDREARRQTCRNCLPGLLRKKLQIVNNLELSCTHALFKCAIWQVQVKVQCLLTTLKTADTYRCVFFYRCSGTFSRFYGQNSALSTVFSSQKLHSQLSPSMPSLLLFIISMGVYLNGTFYYLDIRHLMRTGRRIRSMHPLKYG